MCLQIVTSVFVCFALDREMQQVTRQDVHDIYVLLPTVKNGPVVEQVRLGEISWVCLEETG